MRAARNLDAVFPDLDQLFLAFLEAGRMLCADSLRALRCDAPLPDLLALGGVRAEMRFVAESFSRRQFLWVRKLDVQQAADIRLAVELAPAVEGAEPNATEGPMTLDLPQFMAETGNPDELAIRCADGRALACRLQAGKFEVTLGDAPDVVLTAEAEGLTREAVPVLAAVLDTLAAWQAGGAPTRRRNFVPPEGTSLESLLRTVVDGRNQLGAQFGWARAVIAERAAEGRTPAEWLEQGPVAELAIRGTSAWLRVCLDESGHLHDPSAQGRKERLQQVELSANWDGSGALALGFGIPDFLSAGDVHAQFCSALEEEAELLGVLYETFIEVPGVPRETLPLRAKAEFARWVDALGAGGMVIARMRQDDMDIVRLAGTAGSMPFAALFQINFAVDGTNVRVERDRKAFCLALRRGGDDWAVNPVATEAGAYLYRLLRTLEAWQRGADLAAGRGGGP